MIPDTVNNVVAASLIGLGVCGLIVCVVRLVRQRRKDRQWRQHWERETRIHRRVSELLAQEYENLLTSEARQRREAQRRHLAALRARAEAELDAEEARR